MITAVFIPADTAKLPEKIELPDANRTAWAEKLSALHISRIPCRYSPEAAMIIDAHGDVTYRAWNPRAAKLSGRASLKGDVLIIGIDEADCATNIPANIAAELLRGGRR